MFIRIFGVAILVAGCFGWWKVYIEPNDLHNEKVAACAGPRPTKQAWVACHNRLIGEADGLVATFHP